MRMHADELHIDTALVRELIENQFPEWGQLRIQHLVGKGTTHAIFRIGEGLTGRFPLRATTVATARSELAREAAAMRELADACPYPTPTMVAEGREGHGYPLPWSVSTWVQGDVVQYDGSEQHSVAFTLDLVDLITSLRAVDSKDRDFDGPGRGGDLHDSDEWMDLCFEKSSGLLPVDRLRRLWAWARQLRPHGRVGMTHGDLIPDNLLTAECRLVGVLDGGTFAATDPSLDLIVGWHLLDDARRRLFRKELGCDDLEWNRGAAWALQQSMGLVWYYRESNPSMSNLGRSTLDRLLGDTELLRSAGIHG